ncbi:MAG: DNA polymerase IV, partial [Oscillospiraceae bacterium]|nr:DNA polymerase IV [Oscillospiraceae bacterium]
IRTIGDLAKSTPEMMIAHLGKNGELLHGYANGIDPSPVQSAFSETAPKSISRGITFSHDLTDFSEIRAGLTALSDDVATRLRKHKMCALTVALTVRDPSFRTVTRQKALSSPTHLASDIESVCSELYKTHFSKISSVRMLTVSASNLCPECDASLLQMSLFGEDETYRKRENVELTIDKIRKKFGRDGITHASLLGGDFSIDK